MGPGQRRRPAFAGSARWLTAATAAALAAAVAVGGHGNAALALDGFGDPPEGEWYATMWAELTDSITADGAHIDYAGVVDGAGEFTFSGGRAEGVFVMDVVSVIQIDHPEASGIIDQFWEGDGTIDGNGWVLTMDGSADGWAVGTMNIPGFGPMTHVEEGLTSPIGPFDVPIVEVYCDTIVADWAPTLQIEAAEHGMPSVRVVGEFIATYLSTPEDQRPFFERFEELKAELQDWAGEIVDGAGFERGRFIELTEQLIELEAERRSNIDECIFPSDDDRTEFLDFTGLAAEALVLVLLHHAELDPTDVDLVLDVLLYFGRIGEGTAGNSDPVLRELVTRQLERYLDEHLQTDGTSATDQPCTPDTPCLAADRDGLNLFHTVDRLDLELEVGGTTMDKEAVAEAVLRTVEEDA